MSSQRNDVSRRKSQVEKNADFNFCTRLPKQHLHTWKLKKTFDYIVSNWSQKLRLLFPYIDRIVLEHYLFPTQLMKTEYVHKSKLDPE